MAILMLSVAFSTAASAQAEVQSTTTQPARESHFQENKERLAITPVQQRAYKEITKRYAEELKDVRQSSLSREEKLEKAKEFMAAKDNEMKSFLSPDQFKVYLQMEEERKIRMTERKK